MLFRLGPHRLRDDPLELHIKGLGLTSEGYAAIDSAGFIGQTNAREVCLQFAIYVLTVTRATDLWCHC